MTSSRETTRAPPTTTHSTGQSSLYSVVSITDEFWKKVLALCGQTSAGHFALEFPSTSYAAMQYIDSGTYSHVMKAVAHEVVADDGATAAEDDADQHTGTGLQKATEVVFKIIKVVQQPTYDRFSAKQLTFSGTEVYKDVYQELMMLHLLSNLHQTVCDSAGLEYQTHAFPRLLCTRLVHGPIPSYFIIRQFKDDLEATNSSAEQQIKKMYHFEETCLGLPREHLVTVMKFGGDALFGGLFTKKGDTPEDKQRQPHLQPQQLLSLCLQTTLALAVVEAVYQFEHRDLHLCNILVKATKKALVRFKLRSRIYTVPSFGVKAIIIDVTFSRLALGFPGQQQQQQQQVFSSDLSSRLKCIEPSAEAPDRQEVAYKSMYQLVGDGGWEEWHPETNLIWLRYLLEEVLSARVFGHGKANSFLCLEGTRTKPILKGILALVQRMIGKSGHQQKQRSTVSKLVEKILEKLPNSGLAVEDHD